MAFQVIITDPGISAAEPPGTYAPYDEGVAGDIFLKNASNSTLMGRVWTGDVTAYPDFTHPNASAYWTKQIRSFHDQLPFDGLWIDMVRFVSVAQLRSLWSLYLLVAGQGRKSASESRRTSSKINE